MTWLVIYIMSHGPVMEDDVGMRKSRSKRLIMRLSEDLGRGEKSGRH